MTNARDLGLPRPAAVSDLDWPAEDAGALGERAVEVWQEFLARLPHLPMQRDVSSSDVAAAVAWDVPDAPDDLAAIADLADEFDLWFHVDGAVGAVGALVDGLRDRFVGIDRADSISLDPHKWLYVPIACGMLLIRDDHDLVGAFHVDP